MARNTATFVRCDLDSCKEVAEVYEQHEAPEGWYCVMVSADDPKAGHAYSRQSSFEFHSLRCLEKWAKDRRAFQQATRSSNGHREIPEDRLSAILEAFSIDTDAALSVSDLMELTSIPRDSVDGIIRDLLYTERIVQTEERRGPFAARYKLVGA